MSTSNDTVSDAPAPAAAQNCPKLPNEKKGLNALSDKQRIAIERLMMGASFSKIAEELAIGRRTLFEWRHKDPNFVAELERRRRELWGDSADHLRALLPDAVEVLESFLRDTYDKNRFKAATTLLRLANVRSAIAVTEEKAK
jgi:transposase-like protein